MPLLEHPNIVMPQQTGEFSEWHSGGEAWTTYPFLSSEVSAKRRVGSRYRARRLPVTLAIRGEQQFTNAAQSHSRAKRPAPRSSNRAARLAAKQSVAPCGKKASLFRRTGSSV